MKESFSGEVIFELDFEGRVGIDQEDKTEYSKLRESNKSLGVRRHRVVWRTQQFRSEAGCLWEMVRKRLDPKGRGALCANLRFLCEIEEVIPEGGRPGKMAAALMENVRDKGRLVGLT